VFHPCKFVADILTVARVSTKRLVKAAAGEVVVGKISANFLRVSIAYIIVYSCMQRFTVADRW